MTGPGLGLVRWLLFLLHLLLLLEVALLHLLCLLLMALLYLLSLGCICILSSQVLVFFLLLLLELLALLILAGVELLLLLQIFLIQLGIACVWSGGPLQGRKFVGMDRRASGVCSAIRWRFVSSSCFPGPNGVLIECARSLSGRDGRLTLVDGGTQISIGAGRLKLLRLRGDQRDVPLARITLFFPGRSLVDAAVTAVVADAVRVVIEDSGIIDIVDNVDVHIVHLTVVEKVSAIPAAAFVTVAEVTEAVIDAAIETNVRSPVTFMKEKAA